MQITRKIAGRLLEMMIPSIQEEVLESEGATQRGIRILDELNHIYSRTGVIKRMTQKLAPEVRSIYNITKKPVKILEIGMRDGIFLRSLGEYGRKGKIPMDLQGIEFKANMVSLAKSRLASSQIPVQVNYGCSPSLKLFDDQSFDLVYSIFTLHHQSPHQLREYLSTSIRLSRFSIYHIDLSFSIFGLGLFWTFCTLFGFLESRKDVVLSCRKAYRKSEIESIIRELSAENEISVNRVLPFYLHVRKSTQLRKL